MGSQSRSFKSSSSLVLIETAWCRHSCKGADTDSKPEMHCSKPFFPAPTLFLNFFFCHCQHEIEETHFTGGGQRSYDEDGSSTKRWLAKWDSCNAISWICNVAPALSSWHHSSRVIRSMSESVCRHPKVSSTAAVIFSTLVIESIIVSLYVPLTDTRVDAWCKLKFIISASTITALASPVIDAVSDLGFSLSLTLIWSFSDLNCPICPVCSSSSSSNSSSLNFNLPPCTTAVRQKKMRSTVQCCANYTERCALLTVRCAPLRHILSVMWKQKRQWQQTRWASDAAQRQMKPQKGAFSSQSTPYGRWCRRLLQCYSMQSISTDLWHLLHNHDRTGRISSHNSAFGIDQGRCNCRASTSGDSQSSSSSRPQWSPIRWPFDGEKHQHEQTTFEGQMVAVDRGQCVWPGPHWKRELCVCSSEGGPSHDLLRAVQQTNTLWWQTICEFDLHLCTHLNAQTHCT